MEGLNLDSLWVLIDDNKDELKTTIIDQCTQIKNLLGGAPQLAIEDEEEEYDIKEELGQGTYGRVLSIQGRVTGKVYAMKILPLNGGVIEPSVARELSIMFDTKHENIVRLERVFTRGTSICLIMERLKWDLSLHLKLYDLDEEAIKRWLKQILSAVAYLHERKIIHRDLKPENILVVDEKNIKLADFGSARGWFEGLSLSPQVTTLQYRAPEVLLGSQSYTSAIDIWSIGCIFGEMADSVPLFGGDTDEPISLTEMMELIFQKLGTPVEDTWPGVSSLPNFPQDLPTFTPEVSYVTSNLDAGGNDLLRRLLCVNPSDRISAEDALKHPYLQA